MKDRLTTFMLILVLLVGLSLLLYPIASDYLNSRNQSKAIASYSDQVADMDEEKYQELWAEVAQYNQWLLQRENPYAVTDEQRQWYNSLLNINETGIIGYVEIPSIKVSAPIYHGTEEKTLQVAIGHLEWTSLPGGGEDTHCVFSGHRGLPSAKLFTDLDKMVVGDLFMLKVLDKTFTYQVDQILIVEPDDTNALMIVEGEDYCTLVTCTPYGVNSHRMLVRGHRVENLIEAPVVRVTADAVQVDPLVVSVVVAGPMLLVFVLLVSIFGGKQKRRYR